MWHFKNNTYRNFVYHIYIYLYIYIYTRIFHYISLSHINILKDFRDYPHVSCLGPEARHGIPWKPQTWGPFPFETDQDEP